jgi:predicted nucleotidyltransferase
MNHTVPALLEEVGLGLEDVPSLVHAHETARHGLRRARSLVSPLRDVKAGRVAVFALGSYGRMEATEASDLDLAFIYDGRRTELRVAERLRGDVIGVLRTAFDVPEKTFHQPVDLRALMSNVGGTADSNEHLTYRALLLTEGAWINDSVHAERVLETLFGVYAKGRVSRGRFLNSLANDLHRYYRTLCVDYRHKVEESAKHWAIRILKLRHSRKLWHLANVCLQCWAVHAVEDEGRDAAVAERLGWPPLVRITLAMRAFGGLDRVPALFEAQDRFLALVSSESVRDALAAIEYEHRHEAAVYQSLHANADRLDEAAAGVVSVLWEHCRAYLVRYCLL